MTGFQNNPNNVTKENKIVELQVQHIFNTKWVKKQFVEVVTNQINRPERRVTLPNDLFLLY